MKRAAFSLAVVVGLVLTGCTANAPTPSASPTPTAASEPSQPAAEEKTALGLCQVMGEKFLEYPSYVLAVMDGDISTHSDFLAWADRLTDAAPADARAIVAKYTDPIYQVDEVVQAGGGSLTLKTDNYKSGNLELMEYCVDAGYKVDQ